MPEQETVVTHTPVHGPTRAATDLRRGTVLDRYVVLEKLGQGGMGVVYDAHPDGALHRDPARARQLALQARDVFGPVAKSYPVKVAGIEDWLRN